MNLDDLLNKMDRHTNVKISEIRMDLLDHYKKSEHIFEGSMWEAKEFLRYYYRYYGMKRPFVVSRIHNIFNHRQEPCVLIEVKKNNDPR